MASADGMRFVVPVRTLNAGANSKYFNRGRGITYYNYTSDQFTGFHGVVVPGTLRDSIAVLVGLLEQQTSLRPRELMTDTSGYSDVVFGLFWLLGYQFSPRLADGRRILTQLNRGESRHSLARAVFHGRRGEVRQRYREGQEGVCLAEEKKWSVRDFWIVTVPLTIVGY